MITCCPGDTAAMTHGSVKSEKESLTLASRLSNTNAVKKRKSVGARPDSVSKELENFVSFMSILGRQGGAPPCRMEEDRRMAPAEPTGGRLCFGQRSGKERHLEGGW